SGSLTCSHSRPRARGQATVEMAITVTLLLLMGLGVFDLGSAFTVMITLDQAAREGARIGMDASVSDDTIRSTVTAAAGSYSPVITAISRPTSQVSVTASYSFTSALPIVSAVWGGGGLVISRTHVAQSR